MSSHWVRVARRSGHRSSSAGTARLGSNRNLPRRGLRVCIPAEVLRAKAPGGAPRENAPSLLVWHWLSWYTQTGMVYAVTTLHVLICLFLIIVVLLQSGKAADL